MEVVLVARVRAHGEPGGLLQRPHRQPVAAAEDAAAEVEQRADACSPHGGGGLRGRRGGANELLGQRRRNPLRSEDGADPLGDRVDARDDGVLE
jgi:hypothetical protein